ncbi:MAG: type II secretion system F family protein [Bdellovibrionales bacterium]|nr:type II secretion system F family protein [Bdellovibrionales bacterium]
MQSERLAARRRTAALLGSNDRSRQRSKSGDEGVPVMPDAEGMLARLIVQSGADISARVVLRRALLLSIIAAALCLPVHIALSGAVGVAAGALPFMRLLRRRRERAALFSRDYPSVLLAASSSIKAGLTVHGALERSVRLLSKQSPARVEVEQLMKRLEEGASRDVAVAGFGRTVQQPDLPLFRSALSLVLENGGRFAPTLERLARVCQDRESLARSARVRTSGMRMTANILLGVTPLILLMVAVRTEENWDILLHHPVARTMGLVGAGIILVSYCTLRRMSCFEA